MAHISKDKQKIIPRVNRIKGQLDAFAKGVEEGKDCYQVLQLLASCRGALNGLMAEVVERHIREHIIDAENKKDIAESGEDLVDIMKSFLK